MSILMVKFVTIISGVILKTGINIDTLIYSKTANVKKLNKLDKNAKLRSTFSNVSKITNNKMINRTV